MTTRGKWLDGCLHKHKDLSKGRVLKHTSETTEVPRYFQVRVNVLDGKKFAWMYPCQASSYVIVALDKVKYRSSVRMNMKVPYYRENFMFELCTSACELKRKCVWVAVMEPGYCTAPRLMGEGSVDLALVWGQPHHTITHKWVQLTLPSEGKTCAVGYLKVDVAISCRRDELAEPELNEGMEDDLLLPNGCEQQPACYQITIYRAYNIPCSAQTRPDILGKPPSTSLRVTFCDIMGETSVQHRTINPIYVERVSMVEMFPNVCEVIQLEVCSAGVGSKVLASTRLKLCEISHGGENGFLPTFGPSLLHMYGPWHTESPDEDGPFHRGALLLTMKTIVPYYRQCPRAVNVEPVSACMLDTEWIIENFAVFCPIFEVSMLDKSTSGTSCGVAITLGDIPFGGSGDPDTDEFVKRMAEIRQKKQHYTGGMAVRWNNTVTGHLELETYPVLQLATRLPDFRFRMYRNNVIYGIVADLEQDLSDITARLKLKDYGHPNDLLESLHCANDDAAAKIQKFLDIVRYSSSSEDIQKYTTELDQKLVQLQKEKIEKTYCRIVSRKCKPFSAPSRGPLKVRFADECDSKKPVKIMLAECRTIVQELKDLIFKTPDGWPEMSVWLLSNGSRVAYSKIAPADVIHSVISEQNGRYCGKIQTIYLKPIKCSKHRPADCTCISAKVELLAWMGAYRQRGVFQYCLPEGHCICESGGVRCSPMSIECCVNIYRAKLESSSDVITGLSPFVRINFLNNVKDTKVCQHTCRPVWCEVLRVANNVNTSPQRLENSPPEILVEVYHWDSTQTGKVDLLGRVTIMPVFLTEQDDEPPSLVWYDLRLGTEHVGKIQMSAQITQTSENLLRKTWMTPQHELLQRSSDQIAQFALNAERREPLPVTLLPDNMDYKIDVYFWGLREVSITNKPRVTLELEDITIKSAIISHCQCNSNFPNARMSQTFQGNITNGSSPLTIKLYDTTTFGRALFAGLNVVNKPQKYLVTWLPKKERDESLYMKAVVSNNFTQVYQNAFVKRNNLPSFDVYSEKSVHFKNELPKSTSFWDKIAFYRKPEEEENIMLLPIYSKEKNNVTKETDDDWWSRYYASVNDKSSGDKEVTTNKIMIYDSELEAQPEFAKFKDWSSTIKIYNGDKTGIPEKDEKLRCGYLKACIAIYQWPPLSDSAAVTTNGADLERGYFDTWPTNDPARYLVRVYAVKCTGLVSKGFTATSKCYVSVQCNNTRLSDRDAAVARCADPLFGKMFEFHCSLPEDYLLKISVMDCGAVLPDDLIGTTVIDLEDRVYTKYRATVGLAADYNINGPNKWRDSERPSAILVQLCEQNNLSAPEFPDPSTVVFNGVEYKDHEYAIRYPSPLACKENLCLSILHKWYTLPMCGHKLVPEHVETRTLYDPESPGVEQGKIHLWVDMFSLDSRRVIPAAVSIRPRPDEHYELRVTVWDVQGIKIDRKSSIYVRAWIGPSDEAQDTDIYTSNNGEGHFNWRMIFQFQYKHTERKLVLHDKGPFTEVTELFPPILVVQVLDIDAPTLHDYLGTLTLDLSHMPRGSRAPAAPSLRPRSTSLFSARHARGWWPLRAVDRGTANYHDAGMIDLEISLLPKEKAILMPVGLGRDPPSPLSDPLHQPKPKQTLSVDSVCPMSQYRHGMWTLAILGLVVIGGCMYWDLPVIVFSVIPSRNIDS